MTSPTTLSMLVILLYSPSVAERGIEHGCQGGTVRGGGLTDERRAFREKLRLEAAERFRQGDENTVIAHDLRVSLRSVQRWWHTAGPDQTWTLARIKTLIGRRFHKSYTVQGMAALLKRHGWSCQVPTRRAIEREENLVAGWVKETWPQVEGPRRRSAPGPSSRTKPGSR
ncbi:winged helix-turn-helix domain-containing protein [Streptomyces sp. NPDC029674]|uniref:helix-turn-helix domain-containing protein n=1 Tax=Streptomyces sp. NPDC029674 TaxID=3365297 RepID=UPI00384CA210